MKSAYLLRLESQMRPLVAQLEELNGLEELSDAQRADFDTITAQLSGMKSDYERAAERATKTMQLSGMVETLTADAAPPRAITDRSSAMIGSSDGQDHKSWFDALTEHKDFRRPPNNLYNVRLELPRASLLNPYGVKAAFVPGNMAGATSATQVYGPGTPRPRHPLLDLIRQVPTNEYSISYLPLTFTNNAAATALGQPKPESTNAGTIQSIAQSTIAHWKDVVRQALRYLPTLRGEVESEMSEGVLTNLERDIISGSGIAPIMKGLLAQITNDADGADLVAQIFDAIGRIEAAGGTVDAILMNPQDYAALVQAEWANNQFNPLLQGGRFGEYRIVRSGAMPAGEAIVADWGQAIVLYVGENVRVDVTEAVGYKSNIVTFRGEMDAVVLLTRPWLAYHCPGPLVFVGP